MTSSFPQGPDLDDVQDDYFFTTTSEVGDPLTGDNYFTARWMMVWNEFTATWDQTEKPPLEAP